MRCFFIIFLVCFLSAQSYAEVLIFNPDGTYSRIIDLATAASEVQIAGKTVIVTSPQIIATELNWPIDRELRFENGGYVTFTGKGKLTGLKEARPEWFGVNTIPGTTNMTSAVRAACAAALKGEVIFSQHYKVDTSGAPIAISIHQKLKGTSRSAAVISNTSTTDYTFQYLSQIGTPGGSGSDIEAGLVIEDISIYAKFGIKFNSNGDYVKVHLPQSALKSIIIRHCSFYGTYSNRDPNYSTDVYPLTNIDGSDNELLFYGCAINGAKLFDSLIQSNLIQGYGIGIYLDGSDINNIDTNRFSYNARHVHIFSHNTWGYQNKIQNNDIIHNYRRGGIYDTANMTSIKDNYFEAYSLAAEAITQRGGNNTLIWGNRFDNSGVVTPIISLAPTYGCIVSANRTNPNIPIAPIEILPTNYNASVAGVRNNYLVKFTGNSGSFTETKAPYCEYDFNDPRLFNAFNPKAISGNQSLVFPFKISSRTGKQVLKTDISSLVIFFDTLSTDLNLILKFTGSFIKNSGFVKVFWGGVTVYSGYIGFINKIGVQVIDIPIKRPLSVDASSGLSVELVNTEVEYESIAILPN